MLLFQLAPPPSIHVPSEILNMFSDEANIWQLTLKPTALWIWGVMAVFDFWGTAVKIGWDADVKTVIAAITKTLLRIGFFFCVVIEGISWMQSIVDSFVLIGQRASGIVLTGGAAVTPSNVFFCAFRIAGAINSTALNAGIFKQLAISPFVHISVALIVLAYGLLTLAFILYKAQTIISVSLAYIFTGFGGSAWTQPYCERYITMVLSAAFRLMVFFVILNFNHHLAFQVWIPLAQRASGTTEAVGVYLQIMGEVLLWTILCWLLPAVTSHMLSGALSLGAEHIIATVAPAMQAGIAVTSLAVSQATGGGMAGALGGVAKAASSTAGAAQGGSASPGGAGSPSAAPPQPSAPVGAGSASRNGSTPPQPVPPRP